MGHITMKQISFFNNQRRFQREGAGFTVGLRRDFGDMIYLDVPFLPRIYFLFHPDHIHELLVQSAHQIEKPELITRVLRSSFGNGIFSSGGTFWRRQRRLIQPAFHHAGLGQYAEQMVAQTEKRIAQWREGDIRDIGLEMHALTLTIVVEALFSADVSGETDIISGAMHDLGVAIAAQGASLPLAFVPDWVPLPVMRRKRHGVETINQIIYRMIAERRTAGEANSPKDLLTALVFAKDAETGEDMNDLHVRDELMTLFIAGHDTTASLLGWVWVLLARHPEIEAKLQDELKTVLNGRAPALADLPQLPFTEQVIKEALRLYPPAWFIMRQAKEALVIGGESLHQNAIIFVFPYATHRDERWFSGPEQFVPERWDNAFEKSLPKGAYFPFGMGPRVCIGNGFALMEAQLLLATIAQSFVLELLTEARPVRATGTLGFEQPVQVRLHRREA